MVQKQEEMIGCGLNVSPPENGRKNKRKLADPSTQQQNTASASSLTEFPRYELPCLKSQNHSEVGSKAEEEEEESDESIGWDDPFACHLEELLSSNLLTLFLNAMKQVIDLGYTDDDVLKAISGSRLYCGGNDLVSNIVNNTLSVLKNGGNECGGSSFSRDYVFEDLQQLVAYTLVEMISLVKEVRPTLSTVEAMWRLLMCDLNVLQAFEVENDGLVSSKSSESTNPPPNDSDNPKKLPQSDQSEPLKFGNFPNITKSGKEVSVSSCEGIRSTSFTLVSDEKMMSSCRKGHRTKKELAMLRQRSCVEKIRTYSKGSCGGYKAAKFASVGSFLLEKRVKSSSAELMMARNACSSKITAEIGVKLSLTEESGCYIRSKNSSNNNKLDSPVVVVDAKGYIHALPASKKKSSCSESAEKKSVSAVSEKKTSPVVETEEKVEKIAPDYYAGIPFDASQGIYLPRDKKDELILKLVPRVSDLENELQVWTDWANQKVKEATCRLLKDQPELKALRKEREEVAQHKKEKQLLEENTLKRLSEMEFALKNATNQFEKANNTVRRLEVEQSLLKKEMEAAKVKASESAENCKEAKERGEKSLKDTQSWEGQKIVLQEELKIQRDKVIVLQKEVAKAKNRQNQIEVTLKQEKTAKAKLAAQASTIKKERKEIEAMGKLEEERIKAKAETDVKYYAENIQRLEREMSTLKLKSDYSRIAALKKSCNDSTMRRGGESLGVTTKVKRERECVMCLSEEMSVIFLPCAHQVLCVKCNELHEKEGMVDCPSCRGTIQRRIHARFAHSG